MTCHDAAVLARAGARHRPFLAAALRLILGTATDDDRAGFPPRYAGERLAAWLCRAGASRRGRFGLTADRLDQQAATDLARAAALGLATLPVDAPGYPPALAAIADPPPLLWLRGDACALAPPGVALVGSRAASPAGCRTAHRLAADLAAAGLVIVSGLARGVDSAAHAGALAAGGRTVAVLGSGHARLYPPEHEALADRIVASGAVVSELPPDAPPRAFQFPLRNRIIAGLCRAVIVVEAPERSGALITASRALAEGRDVMVLPGQAGTGWNRGGHLLIRDGARLVESAADVLDDLGMSAGETVPEKADIEGVSVDELAERTGRPPAAVLADLLALELSGRIQRVGGGRFVRSAGRVLT